MKKILIIASPFCEDFGFPEEVKKEILKKKSEHPNVPDMESFDMLSLAYQAKCDECEELKKANRKLNEELSKYRYFVECQKNEIEKLDYVEKH